MTTENIHTTLDAMLANPKAKSFLNHIVRSYMPVTNVTRVIDKPTGDFKCVITRDDLVSSEQIIESLQSDEFKINFMTALKNMFVETADKTTPMALLIGEKKLGVTGKDTTTFMSYPAYQEFYNWVITKALKGDKHINWLLGSIRRETFMDRAETIKDKDVAKKVQNFKKVNPTIKGATFTLADASDVLSKLKASMEGNNN